MLLAPSPCHKLSHPLGPPPPLERDVLYGRPHTDRPTRITVYKLKRPTLIDRAGVEERVSLLCT